MERKARTNKAKKERRGRRKDEVFKTQEKQQYLLALYDPFRSKDVCRIW